MKKVIANAWMIIPNPLGAEIFSKAGFDSVTVDLQHGYHDFQSAIDCFRGAALHGAQPWVRIPDNDPSIITKVLDAGAEGIICPLISTPEDAQKFVQACYYEFDGGIRSFGPVRAALVHDNYVQRTNEIITTLAMIETKEGFENVEEIAATPELDGLFIGPSDLAIAFGMPPSFENRDPSFLKLIDRIRNVAHAKGILCGIYAGSAEYAREMMARGFDLVTAATDSQILMNGALAALSTLREDMAQKEE